MLSLHVRLGALVQVFLSANVSYDLMLFFGALPGHWGNGYTRLRSEYCTELRWCEIASLLGKHSNPGSDHQSVLVPTDTILCL